MLSYSLEFSNFAVEISEGFVLVVINDLASPV